MHYFGSGEEDLTCASEPSVSQYAVKDYCIQYAANSGIVVTTNADGEQLLSQSTDATSSPNRQLVNGERVFAIFNVESDGSAVSADFFQNGFCANVSLLTMFLVYARVYFRNTFYYFMIPFCDNLLRHHHLG